MHPLIDFEGFPDSAVLTIQYSGITFKNTITLNAGSSLSEIDFPPSAGTDFPLDDSGQFAKGFSTPITDFGDSFTYLEPLAVVAFDGSNSVIVSATSMFSNNTVSRADTGSPYSELIQVSFPGGIDSMSNAGDLAGSSLTHSDLLCHFDVTEIGDVVL